MGIGGLRKHSDFTPILLRFRSVSFTFVQFRSVLDAAAGKFLAESWRAEPCLIWFNFGTEWPPAMWR